MLINEIEVSNFRCHKNIKINFSDKKTLIYGLNGSGKTSIIEAIYILLRGKSFRGYDLDIIKSNCDWYKAIAQFKTELTKENREVRFINQQTKSKQFKINEKKHYRLPNQKKIPVVLFQPDDLNLINGSTSRRRHFFDEIITQLKPEHSSYLSRYEKSLRQRNNLIKNNLNISSDDLFSWDIILSNYGSKIIKNRLELIKLIQENINQVYQDITNSNDEILLEYSEEYKHIDKIQANIFQKLNRQLNNNSLTSVGPHREDFVIKFNGLLANQHTSRGENRSIVLSLKLIEAELIYKLYNDRPIILLDDVLSELDETRRKFLMSHINQNQIIMTSTEKLSVAPIKIIKI